MAYAAPSFVFHRFKIDETYSRKMYARVVLSLGICEETTKLNLHSLGNNLVDLVGVCVCL